MEDNNNYFESDEYLYKNLEEDDSAVKADTENVEDNSSAEAENDSSVEVQDSYADYMQEYEQSQTEKNASRESSLNPDDKDDESKPKKTKLGWISLGLLLGSMFIMGAMDNISGLSYKIKDPVNDICSLCAFVSFVLMIYTRIKYPKDRPAKAVMWIMIVTVIIVAISAIILFFACMACVEGLNSLH